MTARALSTLLTDFVDRMPDGMITMNNVLDAFHERGIAFLLILFAAPMALPVPVPPGINILLATPLLLLTAQQAYGAHKIWLPRKMKARTLEAAKLKSLFRNIIPWLIRIEKLIKPRLGWITQDGTSRFFGVLGFIMALSVCIPLPLTNTVPSFGIALMAIGFTMRDGLAVMIGAIIGMAWVTMLVGAFVVFGPEAFDIIKEAIKSLLA